jgi:hypothetical protein
MSRLLGVLLSTIALVASADAQQNFGRVGAANREVTGTPPGGAVRTLMVGASVVVKERVRTSSSGSTQILFPDQSTLNIGINSDIVIDEFIYNPNARSGAMVASAVKGVLRYVGGQISHTAGATIRTPAVTIGIRGGIVTVMLPLPPAIAASDPHLAGLQGVLVLSHFGQISLRNNTGQLNLASGYATVVPSPSGPIPIPFPLSEQTHRLIMQWLGSRPGQTGGVANIPTNNILPPGFGLTILQDPTNPPGTDPLGYTSIINQGSAAAKSNAQADQANSATPPPPPRPPPPPID